MTGHRSPAIEIEALGVAFRQGRRSIAAVRDLSLSIEAGESFGLEIGRASCRERV